MAHKGSPCPDDERAAEEGVVCAFQRYLNTEVYSDLLDVFDDPVALKQVYLAACRLPS